MITLLLLLLLLLLTAIGLSPGGSGYFTCIENMKLVTNEFRLGGLHVKRVVATWNFGNHLSTCLLTRGNQEKPVSRWPVAENKSTVKVLVISLFKSIIHQLPSQKYTGFSAVQLAGCPQFMGDFRLPSASR